MDRNLTEGERWSRELLDRLREERFAAAAWARFFGDAFRRAALTRARRPELVRQSRRWGGAGLAAAVPFGARPVASWALWWAMVDWHLGMVEGRGLAAADALTLARLWAAPVVRRHPLWWLVAAGVASDAVDGVLARRSGVTRLGRDLDSTADTLFLLAAMRGAVARHGLAAVVLWLERGRLALGTVVTLRSYFAESSPAPVQRGRAPAASLAGAGVVLAASGRVRVAAPLIVASTLLRVAARVTAPAGSAS